MIQRWKGYLRAAEVYGSICQSWEAGIANIT